MFKQRASIGLIIALFSFPCLAHGDIYDLGTDWSLTSNPFPGGVWSLNVGTTPLIFEADLETFGLDTWNDPQPGWVPNSSFNNIVPAWFKATGSFTGFGTPVDWIADDIVLHTSRTNGQIANVTWTSPQDGVANVSGSVWAGREIGRSNDWRIFLNNTLLTGGTVGSGDAFDRASPFDYGLGSGGAAAISNLNVSAGDVIRFEFERTAGGNEDYVAMVNTVNFTAVPEPASGSLLAIGTFAILLYRRKKHSAI